MVATHFTIYRLLARDACDLSSESNDFSTVPATAESLLVPHVACCRHVHVSIGVRFNGPLQCVMDQSHRGLSSNQSIGGPNIRTNFAFSKEC
jgi:hypothetical protein